MKFSLATLALLAFQLLGSSEARRGGSKGSSSSSSSSSDDEPVCRDPSVASVFTMTNSPGGNQVIMYSQDFRGELTEEGRFDTGGKGNGAGTVAAGDPLASQGSLIANESGNRLFAVNSGDNTLSSFRVRQGCGAGLQLASVVGTDGSDPVSVATCGRFVYVLNAGGEGSIVGFRMAASGELVQIEDSFRSVSAINQGSNPAFILSSPGQVSFTDDCSRLVVINKDILSADAGNTPPGPASPGRLLVFGIDRWGMPTSREPAVTDLGGVVPFVFNLLDSNGHTFLYTTDVFADGSSVYELQDDNTFALIQGTVENGDQGAPCWSANNGIFYFIANAGSDSISSYRIEDDNTLTLVKAQAAVRPTGAFPLDMAYQNGYLYQLFSGSGDLIVYSQAGGSLVEVGAAQGLRSAPGDASPSFASEEGGPVGLAVIPDY